MVVSAEEHRLIGQVADRLLAGFPQVPQDTVHELVGSSHHRFDEAPIRDFVPLFVGRHTKERLATGSPVLRYPRPVGGSFFGLDLAVARENKRLNPPPRNIFRLGATPFADQRPQ